MIFFYLKCENKIIDILNTSVNLWINRFNNNMLNLNLKNPQYELERLYNISLKGKSKGSYKLSTNQFIKANIRKIIKEVSEYFVDNPNNFIILCNLLDLNGDGINLRLIDYYCHKHKKEWYKSLCKKYHVLYCYASILTCFITGDKIKVFIDNNFTELTIPNLIFYKHLFEDNIYTQINNNQEKIIKEINTPKNKNNNKIDKDKMMDILNASANFPINQSKIKNSYPKITFEDGSEKIISNINKEYVRVEKIKFKIPTEELQKSLESKLNIYLKKRIELEEGKKKRNKFYITLLVIFIAIISYYIFDYFMFSEI